MKAKILFTILTFASIFYQCKEEKEVKLPQKIELIGNISDTNTGKGIPGVHITLKGNRDMMIVFDVLYSKTDSSGNFKIEYKPEEKRGYSFGFYKKCYRYSSGNDFIYRDSTFQQFKIKMVIDSSFCN